MGETVLFPSPNWFQVSCFSVCNDGWIVYGALTRCLCLLEPIPSDSNSIIVGNQGYRSHLFQRVHLEKIVSVDVSPEWPAKRCILTGSVDGTVKQLLVEKYKGTWKIKSTHSHDIHANDKEEIVGVGYTSNTTAVTVGSFGNVVKWDLNSNVVEKCRDFMRNFKPTCLSCSRHIPQHVAVGTKQGVVFVLSLNGTGKIVYKVRGQDDEIVNLSWCPKYEVNLKKQLAESQKCSVATQRLQQIRQEGIEELARENLENSAVDKDLPEDSFDESVVPEDDTFDIYKDHEADEFGHKKYEPEDIYVKIKEDDKNGDYLEDCLKLKETILKNKHKQEESIESLVNAMDKTSLDSVNNAVDETKQSTSDEQSNTGSEDKKKIIEASIHTYKHLLATIGKQSGVRIWSKTGKLVASCAVSTGIKNLRGRVPSSPNILWYKADSLIIIDGKSQVLDCDPLVIDCKNKLEWHIVHSLHRRGAYCVVSSAPRVQTADTPDQDWLVWTVAQDRNIISYSMKDKKPVDIRNTCGGFIYTMQQCPYDSSRIALGVGDGSLRVWQADVSPEDDSKLNWGCVTSYWQNVQGKILSIAWHPTKENLLAFATAERRVGLIDTTGTTERGATLLVPVLTGPVYSLCWGAADELYASGGGALVRYYTSKVQLEPTPVPVVVEEQKWELSSMQWSPEGILVGSTDGGVALLEPTAPHGVKCAVFVFGKMMHSMEWHPAHDSASPEHSTFKNLIAVCSLDKSFNIVVLEYKKSEDGISSMSSWRTLSGHSAPVLQATWSQHESSMLVSTSQDYTVRVWDVVTGTCRSVFAGHRAITQYALVSARPAMAHVIMSTGGDCSLRLWDLRQHPADSFDDSMVEVKKNKKKKSKQKQEEAAKSHAEDKPADDDTSDNEHVATSLEIKMKIDRKFLLPRSNSSVTSCPIKAVRKMLDIYLEKRGHIGDGDRNTDLEGSLHFLKMFGSINDVNELLEAELARHAVVGNTEAWVVLSTMRGHVDAAVQYAVQRHKLSPLIVALAPTVSLKYWKDVMQLYLGQIDRLTAKGKEEKLNMTHTYGGPPYRKCMTQLALHDVRGCITTLLEAKLYKEAYLVCRTRFMDSIAEEVLQKWGAFSVSVGTLNLAAVIYISLGDLSKAALALGRSNDQEVLCLAAEIAKIGGQKIYANHMEERKSQIEKQESEKEKDMEVLESLPTKVEVLLKESQGSKEPIEANEDCDNVCVVPVEEN